MYVRLCDNPYSITSALYYSSLFFNHTTTSEIYTLSLHDALPIYVRVRTNSPGLRYRLLVVKSLEGGSLQRLGNASIRLLEPVPQHRHGSQISIVVDQIEVLRENFQ